MAGPPPVQIEFAVKNLNETLKAIKTIQDTLTKSQKQSVAATKAAKSEETKAVEKALKDQLAATMRAERTAEAAARSRLAGITKHLRAQYDAEQKELARRHAIRERSAAMAGQLAKREADAEIRARAVASRQAQRIAEQRAAVEARINRQLQVERNRAQMDAHRSPTSKAALSAQARMAEIDRAKGKPLEEREAILERARRARQEAQLDRQKRKQAENEEKAHQKRLSAEVEREEKKRTREKEKAAKEAARAQKKALKEALDEEQRQRERFTNTVRGGISKGASAAMTIAGKATHALLNAGGGFSVDQAIQENLSLERKAAQVSVKTGGAVSPQQAREMSRAVGARTGTDASEVLAGWEAYGDKSGKWDIADTQKGGLADFIAKYSKVTGTDTKQIGYVAGMLRTQNPHLKGDKMQQMLLDVLAQGREGAVDIPELVGHLPAITKTAGRYTGTQEENQRKLLALSQIGVATGTVAEVATGLSNMSADTMKHSDKINALLGRDALDGKGNINTSPEEFIADMMVASGGSSKKLLDAGIGQRAIRVFDALQSGYLEDEAEGKKLGLSGDKLKAYTKEKTLEKLNKPINQTMTMGQLNTDFNTVMQSSAESFEDAVRKLKLEIGDKMIPILRKWLTLIQKSLPTLQKFFNAFTKLAELLMENPLSGFGAVLSGYILKEIAAAKLASAFSGASTGAASFASAAAGAAAAILATKLLIEHLAKEEDEKQKKSSDTNLDLLNNRALLKPGGIKSAADMEKAEKVKANLEQTIARNEEGKGGGDLWKGIGLAGAVVRDVVPYVQGDFSGPNEREMREVQANATARDQKEIDEQKKALAELTKAMSEAAKKISAAGPEGGGKGSQGDPKRKQPIPARLSE